MDATENELKDVSVGSFPTIKYFKSTGEVIDYEVSCHRTVSALRLWQLLTTFSRHRTETLTSRYSQGKRDLEGFTKFLESGGEKQEPEPEEPEEGEEDEAGEGEEDDVNEDAEEAETPVAEPEPPKAEKEEL